MTKGPDQNTTTAVEGVGKQFRQDIIDIWKTKDSIDFNYFNKADQSSWVAAHWSDSSPFVRLLAHLNLDRTAEIACGYGRHSQRIVDRCQELYLVDTSIDALEEARKRFSKYPQVKVVLSADGVSLPGIPDQGLTSIFSYDAMVHFEPLTIACYLAECGRTLVPGGRALLHHSNFSGNPVGTINGVPGWRNYMTQDLFSHFASRAGLSVEEAVVMDWAFEKSDCLSLLVKK